MTILLFQYSVCWRETPDAARSMDMNEYSLKEETGAEYIPKNGLRPEKIFLQERSGGASGAWQGWERLCREACYKKSRFPVGSAFIMQRTELLDQQFAGAQFQLEIKRALHEDLDGFLSGHGILLPWEWLIASFKYLIGDFAEKLDWGNVKSGGRTAEGKKVFALAAFLPIDTIEKIQHNGLYDTSCLQGGSNFRAAKAGKPLPRTVSFWWPRRRHES